MFMDKTSVLPQQPSQTNKTQPKQHHYVRTFFASLFGSIAVVLIMTSVLAVWLNHTVTNTDAYTSAVAPLVSRPEIQNFVADRVTDQIVNSAQVQDLASSLAPAAQKIGATPEELIAPVKAVVKTSVMQVVSSSSFAKTWEQTNRTAHAQLVKQLKSNSRDGLTLDLSPIITNIVDQLKNTRLAPVVDKIDLKPNDAKIDLTGTGIDKAQKYYDWSQDAVIALVVLTVVLLGLTIVISVDHAKTLRRIVLATGVYAAVLSIVLHSTAYISPSGSDADAQKAGLVVAESLTKSLQLTTAVIAVVCAAVFVASKLYSSRRHKMHA